MGFWELPEITCKSVCASTVFWEEGVQIWSDSPGGLWPKQAHSTTLKDALVVPPVFLSSYVQNPATCQSNQLETNIQDDTACYLLKYSWLK